MQVAQHPKPVGEGSSAKAPLAPCEVEIMLKIVKIETKPDPSDRPNNLSPNNRKCAKSN